MRFLTENNCCRYGKRILEQWAYVYVCPRYLLIDKGKQFVAKFFESD